MLWSSSPCYRSIKWAITCVCNQSLTLDMTPTVMSRGYTPKDPVRVHEGCPGMSSWKHKSSSANCRPDGNVDATAFHRNYNTDESSNTFDISAYGSSITLSRYRVLTLPKASSHRSLISGSVALCCSTLSR